MYVVTGGGTGIGKALALSLAKRNRQVLITGRRESLLKEVASMSPDIQWLSADMTSVSGRDRLLSMIQTNGHVEALIHNAGSLGPLMPLMDVSLPDWQKIMSINVETPLFLTQLLAPFLNNGRVLNIGSGAAHVPVGGLGAYCVSKAALHMLTRCLEVEKTEMAFACVMPGIIDTHMQEVLRDSPGLNSVSRDYYRRLRDQNQLVTPETVALFLTWLLLDTSREQFVSKEWDIYDTSHHAHWLKSPHTVPDWSS